MAQLNDHNYEELDGMFTRPTLDLYLCNKYWGFITRDQSKEEIADLEKAKQQLEHYERLYSLMEYGCDLCGIITVLETRLGSNNPSLPQTIYKKVNFSVWLINHSFSHHTTLKIKSSTRLSLSSRHTTG